MASRGRMVLGGLLSVVVIVIIVFFLGYRLLTKSLPKVTGTTRLGILDETVDVYRDSWGVPHIFAQTENDLFKAAGYVTAQDRLWQMDLSRRIATGRLSEIFGKSMVARDKHIRTWGFGRAANEISRILSPESRAALQAYSEGVNAFIQENIHQLPVEFAILRYEPGPWKIEDSLAIARLMAWRLSYSWFVDLVLNELVAKLGIRKARQIFPDFPKHGATIVSSGLTPTRGLADFMDEGLALREFLGMETAAIGSNSWVVSADKSECGKPLLANDPHLELTTPSIWYEMHLVGGRINVAGVALPGTPGLLVGHNQSIAWGLTNGMVDDVDFYLEALNPTDSTQYRSGAQWLNFEEIREDIFVKDDRAVTMTIRKTSNGPVVSDIHPVLADTNLVYSMRWVGHEPSDELAALLKLQVAENNGDVRDALNHFKVPAQNFLWASVDGDIGYQLAGAIPIRMNTTGVLPHQGWTARGQWQGNIPFESLPSQLNPSAGFIATANNKIIDDSYPYYLTNLWEPHSRSARIKELLAVKEKFTLDDFREIQNDVSSVMAQEALPALIRSVEANLDSTDEALIELHGLIRDWDGRETEDSVAASIFHAFFVKLGENILEDEMGEELYRQYARLSNVPFRVVSSMLQKPSSSWFDNVTTPKRESWDEIVVKSLLDGRALLTDMAGPSINDWAWGRIHTLTMEHPLGQQRPIDRLLNLGPYPRGGSTATINNSQYRFLQPFSVHVGASTRQLVDLCNMDRSLSVITSGQSGQRMSEHYKDQTPLWLNGQYHELIMDRQEIVQTATAHLVLEPSEIKN